MDLRETYREFAGQVGAEYIDPGLFGAPKVKASFKNWTVTLDAVISGSGSLSSAVVRFRAPFASSSGFRFVIYRRGWLSSGSNAIPLISTGEEAFDRDFEVHATDASKMLALLTNPKFRLLCQVLSSSNLTSFVVADRLNALAGKLPDGVFLLSYSTLTHDDSIKQDALSQISPLYEAFTDTLQELCRIGAATEADPGYNLL